MSAPYEVLIDSKSTTTAVLQQPSSVNAVYAREKLLFEGARASVGVPDKTRGAC